MARHFLQGIVSRQKWGIPAGVCSVCSAHPRVIRAAAGQARLEGAPLLLEATCHQVNQTGGYTGMDPAGFRSMAESEAAAAGLPADRVILGGDHLGPHPWKGEPAVSSMEKARVMVRSYVAAGYEKIHLDCSMPCVGDPVEDGGNLPLEIAAHRTADLCEAAERAFRDRAGLRQPPLYVIGTEVPAPGGAEDRQGPPPVTGIAHLEQTIEAMGRAFSRRGLQDARERVIAVVMQPGVEFDDGHVYPYDREKTGDLRRFIKGQSGLVYEGHSTDYQTPASLKQMVEDGIAILKVGPALTFAMREAIFLLEDVERELARTGRCDASGLSGVGVAIDRSMREDPGHWQPYYQGDRAGIALAMRYSHSDRIRYYWAREDVRGALSRLMENLRRCPIPPTLLDQYFPRQARLVREGAFPGDVDPELLIRERIREVLEGYSRAVDPWVPGDITGPGPRRSASARS